MILIRREGLKILVFESEVKRDGDVEVTTSREGQMAIDNIIGDIASEVIFEESKAKAKLQLLMEEKK
jgi:hypothetical protein